MRCCPSISTSSVSAASVDAVESTEPMKWGCPGSASATARTSASNCSHPPMSHRYCRWYTGTTMLVPGDDSQSMVLTADASMFLAAPMMGDFTGPPPGPWEEARVG